VTIRSGVVGVQCLSVYRFVLVARWCSFLLFGLAFERFGEPIRHFMERGLGLMAV